MKIFKNPFLIRKKQIRDTKDLNNVSDNFVEIGKLVKEARFQKNISIEELSRITKIPVQTINSIESNIENLRPKYPFIRSILFKLEDCLPLRKNILINLLIKETKFYRENNKKYVLRKFDFLNTWTGSLLYFLILITIVFSLKKFFYSNINVIEIQNFEEQINLK
tara:strand:+ start:466 stop:960 length:495 start_codon:yes stop_codon:yes gene_type:complete